MKKINLSITGCMGRMGQQLIKSSKSNKHFKLVSLTENKIINKRISGIRPSLNNIESFKNTNVIIDFTIPKCTLEILRIASKLDKTFSKQLHHELSSKTNRHHDFLYWVGNNPLSWVKCIFDANRHF